MFNFEWVVESESPLTFVPKGSTPYIRVCTPVENNQLNYSFNGDMGVGRQVPRKGFYLIKDVHFIDNFDRTRKEQASTVLYKKSLGEDFIDIGMSIRLQPLFNYKSECLNGNKSRYKDNPSGLINKVIHVQSSELVDTNYNDQVSKTYKIIWEIYS
jgi:hypothetical protein